jgi:hypothetical protein
MNRQALHPSRLCLANAASSVIRFRNPTQTRLPIPLLCNLQAVQQVQYLYTASFTVQLRGNGNPQQAATLPSVMQAMGALNLAGGGLGVMGLPAGPSPKALPAPHSRRAPGPSCVVDEVGSRGRSASRRPAAASSRW